MEDPANTLCSPPPFLHSARILACQFRAFQMRLNWRSEYAVIGGSKVVIMTYDDLLECMDGRASLVRTLDEEGRDPRSAREAGPNG
jgi:hypothetical protein